MSHDLDLFDQDVARLVQPLDRIPVGRSARIVYIVPRGPEQLVRLASFGVVPGATVRLQQSRPAAVLCVGETTLALDPAIVADIYVKRIAEVVP
jgi:Fe2+ transport system protein FeoA